MPSNRLGGWITVARWLCFLPAGFLASWLFGGVLTFLLLALGVELRSAYYPVFLFPLLQTLPSGLAFTLVGSQIAPRPRILTASILALICAAISLWIHVISQPAPGVVNVAHAAGDAAGGLLGIGLRLSRKNGRESGR